MNYTKGPWVWKLIGEKVKGYVIGIVCACDENENKLSGNIDDIKDVVHNILFKDFIG